MILKPARSRRKKKMKKLLAILLIVTFCCMLASCGRNKSDAEYYYEPSEDHSYNAYDSGSGYAADFEYKEGSESNYSSGYTGNPLAAGLKLTYSANISVETLDYDKSLEAVLDSINKAGGFISYRNEGGGYTSTYGTYMKKWVRLEARIPAGNYQSFLDGTADFGNVTSLLSSMEDITSQYVDTEARLSSLNAQRERLEEMMKKAEDVSDLIEIEAQLSDTIYQIESYTAKKNTFDNLVSYSTVNIELNEVSVVTYKTETFWDRLLATIGNSLRDFADFLEDLLLGIIYLLPFALVLFLIAIPVVKGVKRKRAKKQAAAEKEAQPLPRAVDQD